jgi:hypothetical protein
LSKRLTLLLAGIVATAVVVAGCGSSDDSTETTVTLTKVEFIEQGDAICKQGSKQIEDEADEFAEDNDIDTSDPSKEEQEEVITTVVAPSLQTQADEISELGAPEGEEDEVTAMIDALEAGAQKLEDEPGVLLESDSDPLAEANRLANKFGFEECGQE